MTSPSLPRRGLTLVQTLVVIAIIATLVGLSVVGIIKVRSAAAQAECANQLKQLGLACHAAHDQHKRMPPAFGFYPNRSVYGGNDGLGTLFFHLLPFVDQQGLYHQARHQPAGTPPQDYFLYTANSVHQTRVALFNCPADPTLKAGIDPVIRYAPSSYAGNYLVFGNVEKSFTNRNAVGKPQLSVSFPDGTGTTILFAEKYASASISAANNQGTAFKGGCHWAYFQADCHNPYFAFVEPGRRSTDAGAVAPGRFQVQPNAAGNCNPCLASTGHSAMNACMADATVRTLAAGMEPAVWWSLVTPSGGEPVIAP